MECCCSRCAVKPIRKRLQKRTIREHQRKDIETLRAGTLHEDTSANLRECIHQNGLMLESWGMEVPGINDDMDAGPSGGLTALEDVDIDGTGNQETETAGLEPGRTEMASTDTAASTVMNDHLMDDDQFLLGVPWVATSFPELARVATEDLPVNEDPYYEDPELFDLSDQLFTEDEGKDEGPDSFKSDDMVDEAADDSASDSEATDEEDRDITLQHQGTFSASQEALRAKLLDGYVPPMLPPYNSLLRPVPLTTIQIYSLRAWIAFQQTNCTQATYTSFAALLSDALSTSNQASTDSKLLSIERCRRLAQRLTQFMPHYVDVCPAKCIAYTGDHKDKLVCDFVRKGRGKEQRACGRARYHPNSMKPVSQFMTLPIIPTIQSMFANCDTGDLLRYRDRMLQEVIKLLNQGKPHMYSDFANGQAHINHLRNLGIFKDECDIAFIDSVDGAMLTLKKQSDVWFLILIILNFPPKIRYLAKNVITIFATSGPESPGNLETYMFPAMQELMKMSVGIWIWDAFTSSYLMHHASIVLSNADMPGQTKVDGTVGLGGVHGNRFNIPMIGARSSVRGCKRQYWLNDF